MASQLTSILARSSIEDHAEALSLADAALSSLKAGSPDHLNAQHTKVVALLRLERYDDALRVIADGGDALASRCLLENGYALYKTGALEDAFALLGGEEAGNNSQDTRQERARRHIAAQVAYRLEKFDEASALYEALVSGVDNDGGEHDDEETDLKINLLAAQAQLEWQGRGDLVPERRKQPAREDLEAFETAYNAGCGCVARGDLPRASVLLKRAADLCDATEGLTEEDKRVEMLPIILQQAYVLARLGKKEEAAALQKGVEDYEYVFCYYFILAKVTRHPSFSNSILGSPMSRSTAPGNGTRSSPNHSPTLSWWKGSPRWYLRPTSAKTGSSSTRQWALRATRLLSTFRATSTPVSARPLLGY